MENKSDKGPGVQPNNNEPIDPDQVQIQKNQAAEMGRLDKAEALADALERETVVKQGPETSPDLPILGNQKEGGKNEKNAKKELRKLRAKIVKARKQENKEEIARLLKELSEVYEVATGEELKPKAELEAKKGLEEEARSRGTEKIFLTTKKEIEAKRVELLPKIKEKIKEKERKKAEKICWNNLSEKEKKEFLDESGNIDEEKFRDYLKAKREKIVFYSSHNKIHHLSKNEPDYLSEEAFNEAINSGIYLDKMWSFAISIPLGFRKPIRIPLGFGMRVVPNNEGGTEFFHPLSNGFANFLEGLERKAKEKTNKEAELEFNRKIEKGKKVYKAERNKVAAGLVNEAIGDVEVDKTKTKKPKEEEIRTIGEVSDFAQLFGFLKNKKRIKVDDDEFTGRAIELQIREIMDGFKAKIRKLKKEQEVEEVIDNLTSKLPEEYEIKDKVRKLLKYKKIEYKDSGKEVEGANLLAETEEGERYILLKEKEQEDKITKSEFDELLRLDFEEELRANPPFTDTKPFNPKELQDIKKATNVEDAFAGMTREEIEAMTSEKLEEAKTKTMTKEDRENAKKERKSKIESYREKLAKQKRGLAFCRVSIERMINFNNDLKKTEITDWLIEYKNKYDFTEEQTRDIEEYVDSYFDKRKKVKQFYAENKDNQIELIRKLTNKILTKQQISGVKNISVEGITFIIQTDKEIMLTLHSKDAEDMHGKNLGGFFVMGKSEIGCAVIQSFESSIGDILKKRKETKKEPLTDEEIKKLHEDWDKLLKHELQHGINTFFKEDKKQPKKILQEYEAMNDEKKKEEALMKYFRAERDGRLDRTKGEITASLRDRGSKELKDRVEELFLNRGARYDYPVNTGDVLVKKLQEKNGEWYKTITEGYSKNIREAIKSLHSIVKQGIYSGDMIIALLDQYPLVSWPRAIEGLLHSEARNKRKLATKESGTEIEKKLDKNLNDEEPLTNATVLTREQEKSFNPNGNEAELRHQLLGLFKEATIGEIKEKLKEVYYNLLKGEAPESLAGFSKPEYKDRIEKIVRIVFQNDEDMMNGVKENQLGLTENEYNKHLEKIDKEADEIIKMMFNK